MACGATLKRHHEFDPHLSIPGGCSPKRIKLSYEDIMAADTYQPHHNFVEATQKLAIGQMTGKLSSPPKNYFLHAFGSSLPWKNLALSSNSPKSSQTKCYQPKGEPLLSTSVASYVCDEMVQEHEKKLREHYEKVLINKLAAGNMMSKQMHEMDLDCLKGIVIFFSQLKRFCTALKSLKAQQGLLIDFKSFPQKVIGLLEECKERNSCETGRFSLIFNMSGCGGFSNVGQLSIMETNEFKHLNHLQLEFHPGTDSDIKNYILDKLKNTKYKLDQMTTAYDKTEYELKLCKESLAAKTNELVEVRNFMERRLKEMQSLHDQKLEDTELKHKEELNSSINKHAALVKRLEQKVTELTENIQSLKDIKKKQESQIMDLRSSLSELDEDKRRHHSESMKSKRDLSTLESRNSDLNSQLIDIRSKTIKIESELCSKEEALKREHEQLLAEREVKEKVESELGLTNSKLQQIMSKLKHEHEENRELKAEIEHLRAKMKHRTEVSIKQEEHIRMKNAEIDSLTKKMSSLEAKFSEECEQLRKLKTENESLHAGLEESRKVLQENKELIYWMSLKAQDYGTHDLRDHMKGNMPFCGNSNGNTSQMVDLRDNNMINDNNNAKPIMREDFIDQKYLRSSLNEPLIENNQTPPPVFTCNVRRPSPQMNGPSVSTRPARNAIPCTTTAMTRPTQGAHGNPTALLPPSNKRGIPPVINKRANRPPTNENPTNRENAVKSAYIP